MMKNSTLFIVKKFNYQSVENPVSGKKEAENEFIVMESAAAGPPAQTIRNIMDFARAYNVLETETAGHAEMILN